jgi:pimeloyl-ACP methyl ester carboxylesterase
MIGGVVEAGRASTSDGLGIAYSDVGAGDALPLVCLTGWCSDRSRYDRFIPLAARARRVVSFDWRGHGDSDAPAGDFGLDGQVADLQAVVDACGLDRFAIMSASHAGWVAIELRRRLGDRVAKIVHMDWLVVEPSEPYMALIRQLQDPEGWQAARDRLFEIWRGGVDDAGIAECIDVMNRQTADMWMRSGREIERAYTRNGSPLAALSALDRQPEVLHVYGQPRDRAYLERQEACARDHRWFAVHQVSARSHFTMIETPSEALAVIEPFLDR